MLGAANTIVCSSGLKEAGDIVSCRPGLRERAQSEGHKGELKAQ